jgi:hypothetical protein
MLERREEGWLLVTIGKLEVFGETATAVPDEPRTLPDVLGKLRDDVAKLDEKVGRLAREQAAVPATDVAALERLKQELARVAAVAQPMEQALGQVAKLQDRMVKVEKQLAGYSLDEPSLFDNKNLEGFYNAGLQDRRALADFTTKYRPRSVQIVRREDQVVLREAVSTALLALSHHDEWFVVPVHTADRYQRADLEACFELEEERPAEANAEFIMRLVQAARCQPTPGGWRLVEKGTLVVAA